MSDIGPKQPDADDRRPEYAHVLWTASHTDSNRARRLEIVGALEAAGLFPLWGSDQDGYFVRVKPADAVRAAQIVVGLT